ncbi:MAG: OmpA family protein [Deferribacterales bacterium]
MNKLIMAFFVISCVSVAYAYEKGEMYITPNIGYHIFDNQQDLDDKLEGGIRLGKFVSDKVSIEGEADYTDTDNAEGNSVDATTLNLNVVRHYEVSRFFKPYLFLGVGAMFYDQDHVGVSGGAGANLPLNKVVSIDLRVKDMYMTRAHNDVVPSVGVSFAFGKTVPAPKTEAKIAPVKETPVVAQVAKAPAPAAVAKAPEDSDRDGVFDNRDRCPGTVMNAPVDSEGCPLDSDGDTVFDYMDKCPDTRKGFKVDSDGCFKSLTLDINFKNDSEEIADGYDSEIKDFVDFMNESPSLNIEIQGHTDSTGTDEYNEKLSLRRADAVAKELITKYGIHPSRITTRGFGETMPIVPNDSPENMRKNRRIESVIR